MSDLNERAKWLRQEVFKMAARVRQGHLASVLSEIEILVALFYGDVLRYTAGKPDAPGRDRIIISKGHATMGLYPILADIGYLEEGEIEQYGTFDGRLRLFGNIAIPGIDATTGSLGHGIGIGCGYCIAEPKARTFVVLSEGEMYEGSTWESALFAAHNRLDNLVVIVDRNRKIILGDTEDLVALEPIAAKWESFGWMTTAVDGHSCGELIDALKEHGDKPRVVIANTVKGRGISFMEDRAEWHYTTLTDELVDLAREELR